MYYQQQNTFYDWHKSRTPAYFVHMYITMYDCLRAVLEHILYEHTQQMIWVKTKPYYMYPILIFQMVILLHVYIIITRDTTSNSYVVTFFLCLEPLTGVNINAMRVKTQVKYICLCLGSNLSMRMNRNRHPSWTGYEWPRPVSLGPCVAWGEQWNPWWVRDCLISTWK